MKTISNMDKTKPLVSILLPVHNSSKFLAACLKSLIKQSYKNIEIVAIDDNSIDNSFKILKDFAKKDKRIRVYKNVKNYGIAVTLNRLIKKAKASLIAFMGSSDIAYPQRIKKQVKFILENPRTVAVGNQCIFINALNKPLGKSKFPLHGISMQFETVLVNRALLPKDVLKFDINSKPFLYSDILIKLLSYGKLANLREYLHYRRGNPNIYFSDLRKNIISLIKLWLISVLDYDYRPTLSSLFSPLTKD